MAIGIGEPYRDDNENGVHDAGEVFSDFNTNGTRDDATHPDYVGFNGLLCDAATAVETCSANNTLFVSDQGVIVMSATLALITDSVGGNITVAGVATIVVTVGDNKNNGTISQPMAGGTTVQASTSNGTLVGPSSYAFPCSSVNGPLSFSFSIESDSFPSSGVMTIVVTPPSGPVTT